MDYKVNQILVNAHDIFDVIRSRPLFHDCILRSLLKMTSSFDPKAIKNYRRAIIDLLDTNFSKLNSVLEGSLEEFARKAFEAKLITEQVMKDKSFLGMIREFKAGMEWCRNTLEIQSRCTDFIEILESLGGPATTAGQDLNAKLLILDGR